MEEVQLDYTDHMERPWDHVETDEHPSDSSFQVIPSKVVWHVSEAFLDPSKQTNSQVDTTKWPQSISRILANCAWLFDSQILNK